MSLTLVSGVGTEKHRHGARSVGAGLSDIAHLGRGAESHASIIET